MIYNGGDKDYNDDKDDEDDDNLNVSVLIGDINTIIIIYIKGIGIAADNFEEILEHW